MSGARHNKGKRKAPPRKSAPRRSPPAARSPAPPASTPALEPVGVPPAASELHADQQREDKAYQGYVEARKAYEDLRKRQVGLKSKLEELLARTHEQEVELAKSIQVAEGHTNGQAEAHVDALHTLNAAAAQADVRLTQSKARAERLTALEREVRQALDEVLELRDEELTARLEAVGVELEQRVSREDEYRARLRQLEQDWLAEYQDRRKGLEDELGTLRSTTEAELAASRQRVMEELAGRRAALEEELEKVTGDRVDLGVEREKLRRGRKAIDEEAKRRAALRVDAAEADAALAERRAQQLAEILEHHRSKIAELEGMQQRIGGLDARQIAALQEDNRLLLEERDSQLSTDERLRLARLEAENAELAARNSDLETRAVELQQRALDRRFGDEREEHLRRTIAELETQRQSLIGRCEELRQDLAQLNEVERSAPVFPNLVGYDAKKSAPRTDLVQPPPLGELVAELRRRLRHPPEGSNVVPLDYAEAEIRLFLAGLAMSRLHILEGSAGTGKTTLPRAIARALGGESRVIEVEAGWRDSLDLYGNYSSFERRFDERDFTKAVYAAGCETHRDQLFIVVLDEMNLSRPEQYMSKILSQLEQKTEGDAETFSIALANRQLDDPEPRLLNGGVLVASPNVWLVGTANNDETTETFAPKTHDRSFVMTLQRRSPTKDPGLPKGHASYSCAGISELFDHAESKHAAKIEQILPFFEDHRLLKQLDRVGVMPSARFERQFRRFAAVLLACGGTMGEAVDHMLATRNLHSTPGRFDVTRQMLEQLKDAMDQAWAQYGIGGQPVNARRVVERARSLTED
jgi:hypothetical protein